MAQEKVVEETPLPPYFDRFIEERDRRLSAELGQLATLIRHNTQRIEEMREDMRQLRGEMDVHFRWTIGIMLPIVVGVLAIIIRVFFLEPVP